MPSASLWRLLRSDAPWYALTAGVTSVVTYFALALWSARLDIPWLYQGDSLSTAAHFKTVLEEGWYEYQPSLGAPSGQVYNDFPTADNLHMIAAKIIGLFTDSWPVAINFYFFAGFLLAALSAFWLLRLCRIMPAISVALSVAYAIAPYHFMRGEAHLWLASYYCIPLGLGLLIMILRGDSLWTARPSRWRIVGVLTGRGAFAVVAVALLATSSTYYSVFFLLLLASVGLLVLIRDRSWRRFFGAAGIGVVTVVVMLINMAPDILYSITAGPNLGGFLRGHAEAEIYALKLSQLLLPWPGHRIDALQSLRSAYDSSYPLVSEQPALGLLGAVGMVIALVFLAYAAVSLGRRGLRRASPRSVTISHLSALIFIAFLFSTVGGLSTFISFLTDALRGWNRMSIVIAALALAVLGVVLHIVVERFVTRAALGRAWRVALVAVVSIGLIGVAYVDQTPRDPSASYASIEQQYEMQDQFFSSIESELPADSMVLQLPFVPYPESTSPTGIESSEELIPYLHSTSIRWTQGGIKGRPASEWPEGLSERPPSEIATLAAAAGASGILLDTAALRGGDTDLEPALRSIAGEPLSSEDGRWEFFDLRPIRQSLESEVDPAELDAIASRITVPVTPFLQPDFTGFTTSDLTAGTSVHSKSVNPAFTLVNPTGSATPVVLTMTVSLPDTAGDVTVTYPDGQSTTVAAGKEGVVVSHAFVLEPGSSEVRLQAAGSSSSAPVTIEISHVTSQDGLLQAFLDGLPSEAPASGP